MLSSIRIANLAVIESADVVFAPGFNALTGETGAGKSILADAIELLLGGRASGDDVRSGAAHGSVEGTFQTADRVVVVRREIGANGRSRAFLDGAPVTAAQLKETTLGLVDVHGQHEHQRLMDPTSHLGTLDGFAALDAARALVADGWKELTRLEEAHRRASMDARERAARIEWLAFQLGELESVKPRAGEDEALAADKQRLLHAERVQRLCREAYDALVEREGAAQELLGGVWRRVDELSTVDAAFAPFADARHGVADFLDGLVATLRSTGESLEDAEAQLTRVESRLASLDRLKRQHGPALDDVLRRWEGLAAERQALDGRDAPETLAADVRRAEDAYLAAARRLSAARHGAATRLASAVEGQLRALAMEDARFELRLQSDLPRERWTENGIDAAEFYVSANLGEDLRPLVKVASGGELSRLMLALQLVALPDDEAARRTVVFDEVDAGIGGTVAQAVGESLRELATRCQVICITHLASIAARAELHLFATKAAQAGRTSTTVRQLDGEERVVELSRMVAGREGGEAAILTARELLRSGTQGESRIDDKRRKRKS